jgi:hypothetical protein
VSLVYENFRRLHKIANSNRQLLHVCLSLRPSVFLSVRKSSVHTGRLYMKCGIWLFFESKKNFKIL